jgi:hypothetical protein
MSKKPLLFIDTNIFLDFYRAEGDAGMTLLNRIDSVSPFLMMTDQVEMEFPNNRQHVISAALKKVTVPNMPPFVPAYLSDSKMATGIGSPGPGANRCVGA